MFEQFEEIRRRVAALEARINRPLPSATTLVRSTAPSPDYRSELPAEPETGDECCMGGKRTERWCRTRRSESERRVLDAARKLLESWEDHEAFPDQGDLPEEYELCLAAADLRAVGVDAELARREGVEEV